MESSYEFCYYRILKTLNQIVLQFNRILEEK